jgi:hypothetical protein
MTPGRALQLPAVRVGLGVALVLMVPVVAMLVTDEVVWSLGDFVVAGVFLAVIGIALELAARRAGSRLLALGVAVVGVAAAVMGRADDAPGLVLLGIVLAVCACALGVRSAGRAR